MRKNSLIPNLKSNYFSSLLHFSISDFDLNELQESHKYLEPCSFRISKNDLMFKYELLYSPNFKQSAINYFNSGFNTKEMLMKLILEHRGRNENKEVFLDFASGYGRVSRFISSKDFHINVSDIKTEANDFQKNNFGFESHTIQSVLDSKDKFDITYVGSLFSHLPLSTFSLYLEKLLISLKKGGSLILSTHDFSLLSWKRRLISRNFLFFKASEDILFPEVEDHLSDTNSYGATYITERYFNTILNNTGVEINNFKRYPRLLNGNQDIYFINKK